MTWESQHQMDGKIEAESYLNDTVFLGSGIEGVLNVTFAYDS